MALIPGRWTVKDVLSVVREMTDTTEQRQIISTQGRYLYNLALSEVVGLLNNVSDPSYFHAELLNVYDSPYLFMVGVNDGGSVGVKAIIEITQSGSGYNIKTNNLKIWSQQDVGSLCFINIYNHTLNNVVAMYALRVVSIVNNAIAFCELVGGGSFMDFVSTDPNLDVMVTQHNGLTHTIAFLNTLSKPVDRIITILDSSYGEVIEVPIHEFASITRTGFSHKSYSDDIVYTRIGNTLLFKSGSNILSPSQKTIYYQRQPDYANTLDDPADIPDKFVPLLVKRIYTYMILQLENDIPKNLYQEMSLDYQQIAVYSAASLANKVPSPVRWESGIGTSNFVKQVQGG